MAILAFQKPDKVIMLESTDGLTVTRLERPEFETADGISAFEHDYLVRFLKC